MRGIFVDRKNQLLVAGLLAVLGLAFLLVGPGRAWGEQMFVTAPPSAGPDGLAAARAEPMPPPPAPEAAEGRTAAEAPVSDHDPMLDDPIAGPPPPRDLARARQAAAAAEERARALSKYADAAPAEQGDGGY